MLVLDSRGNLPSARAERKPFSQELVLHGSLSRSGERHVISTSTGAKISVPILDASTVSLLLALPDTGIERLGIDEVLSFLANVGKNWKSPSYPRRILYIRQLQRFLGYSEQQAKLEADWIAMVFSSHFRLADLLSAELGSHYALDRWIPVHEAEIKARPLGQVLHCLAGNVPLSGVLSILRGVLTRNSAIVKASSDDLVTPFAVAQSFADVDRNHPIARSISVVHWKGSDSGILANRLAMAVSGICVWGGLEAVQWARQNANPQAPVIAFGPKESCSIVGRRADVALTAERIAHDVGRYDQKACFSCRRVYIELGNVEEFVVELGKALTRFEEILPSGQCDDHELADRALMRLEARFSGYLTAESSISGQWSIVVCAPEDSPRHPMGRTVMVHPVDSWREALPHLGQDTQTVSVTPESLAQLARDALSECGVSRIVEPGLVNLFRVGTAHDGSYPLRQLVRLVSHELPSSSHIKGITMKVDQTRFLDEDIFSELIP